MKSYFLCVRLPFAFAVALLLIMGVFAKRGLLDWRRMVVHNADLVKQTELARVQRDDLEKQIRALQSSPFAQEQAVRQHLGYLRKDEMAIEF